MEKCGHMLNAGLLGIFVLLFALWAWCKPADEQSLTERRKLASLPEINGQSLLSGAFMTGFEKYAPDQFPLRESFRRLRALWSRYGLGELDSHGVYLTENSAAKLDYPLQEESVTYAAGRFTWLYETYMQGEDTRVYAAVIPDKSYFAAGDTWPAMDYEKLIDIFKAGTGFAQYIDLFPLLSLEDYYRTDAHWRQEALEPVAQALLETMGAQTGTAYVQKTLEAPFYGVYYGQSALPMEPDTLRYLTNDTLAGLRVHDYETEAEIPLYDEEKAWGRDPYEMFLGGSKSLLTIENPCASGNRELILFRDSFGSSLAPLLAEDYARITLADIRYISPALLSRYVDFHGKDVLFLYSTSVLNHSETIK